MIRVEWRGPEGPRWIMEGAVDDIGATVLTGVSGMVASVQRAASPTSHRRGVTLGPLVIGEMTGGLKVAVRGMDGEGPGEAYELLDRSFSTEEPGTLIVVDGASRRWHVDAVLAHPLDVPEMSSWAPGRNVVQAEIPLRAPGGVWVGDTEVVEPVDGVVGITNRGSLTAYPMIVWSGSGCRVQTPAGVVVALPSVSAPRWLSTDPGRGFVVTDGHDAVDTAVWAAMRGLPVWGELRPRRDAEWRVLSGQVHFEMTPMIENPWR